MTVASAAAVFIFAALSLRPASAAKLIYKARIVEETGVVDMKQELKHSMVAYSGDGYHVAYLLRGSDFETWHLDAGKVVTVAHDVTQPYPSPVITYDGSIFAFVGELRDALGASAGKTVYVNGTPGSAFDRVSSLEVSEEGNHLAFKALSAPGWAVFWDGSPGPTFQEPPTDPIMSREGINIAYVGEFSDGKHIFLNHKPVGKTKTDRLFLTPDFSGQASEEVDFDGRKERRSIGLTGGGKRYSGFKDATEVLFSDDGRKMAVVDHPSAGEYRVLINGKQVGPAFYSLSGKLRFSPSGQAYWIALDESLKVRTLYRDGAALDTAEKFFGRRPPAFSSSGSRAAWISKDEGQKARLVVDGATVMRVADPPELGYVAFDSDRELHWISVSKRGFDVNCVLLDDGDEDSSVCMKTVRHLFPQAVSLLE
ncbi:MAG: hypothetical protein HY078_14525 [Elusimicrobia bacterium]|nr:hypothetical protein [Elusimicrobiota bacterium]